MDSQNHFPASLPSIAELLPSTDSASVRSFSPHGDVPSGSASHTRKVSLEKRENLRAQVASSAAPWRLQQVLTRVGTGESPGHRCATTICMLPDNVLLEIFDSYRNNEQVRYRRPYTMTFKEFQWHILAHVCRRWREIVFASPHHLKLRIVCNPRTPVRKHLDIMPAFPIVVEDTYPDYATPDDEDNVIAALEHADRVCDLQLKAISSKLGKVATVMRDPFPVLTRLYISSDGTAQVFPGGFLGGSAPSLQTVHLDGIPFPSFPTFLMSASDLVTLQLWRIPPAGYISPEALVVGLAAFPRLKDFHMEFQSATSRPDQLLPPPTTRTILPALNRFEYKGASEYLEALVAQIDGPQLSRIDIHYFNQLADFGVRQLSRFIHHSGPEITRIRHAVVIFYSGEVNFAMYPHANDPYSYRREVIIGCKWIDWQVSHIAQVLSQFCVTLSSVVHLQLKQFLDLEEARIDDVEWLHLLQQFPTVRTLHVNWKLAGHVALALEDISGRTATEVLPSLELIWIGDRRIKKFDAARRVSGHPVNVCTKEEFDKRLEFYLEK